MEDKIIKENQKLILQPTQDVFLEDDLMVVREEIKELFKMLNPGTKVNHNIKCKQMGYPVKYVWGFPGTGKTVMLRWFEHKIKNLYVKTVFINCRTMDKPSDLFKEIEKKLKEIIPEPTPKDENIRARIVEYIENLKNQQIFLILDEIDKPLRNSKSSQQDEFLHFLLRLVSVNKQNNFKIIISSNVVNLENMLSPEVMSLLISSKIYFGAYPISDMVEILKKRAERALYDGTYQMKDLALISKMTHEVFMADMRTALNMLLLLAEKSENKLDISKLDEVVEQLNMDILHKAVLSFPKGAQILLMSLVNKMDNGNSWFVPKFFPSENLYEIYCNYCDTHGYNKSKKSMFYNYLSALKNTMILSKKTGGYTISEDPEKLHNCLSQIL